MSDESKVQLTVADDATADDLRAAFQVAMVNQIRKKITPITNGEVPDAQSPINIFRYSEDLYYISGYNMRGTLQPNPVAEQFSDMQRDPLPETVQAGTYLPIMFQCGPRHAYGANGVTIESLLVICKDRLMLMNQEPYDCAENARAIECIDQTLDALNARMLRRLEANVADSDIPDGDMPDPA